MNNDENKKDTKNTKEKIVAKETNEKEIKKDFHKVDENSLSQLQLSILAAYNKKGNANKTTSEESANKKANVTNLMQKEHLDKKDTSDNKSTLDDKTLKVLFAFSKKKLKDNGEKNTNNKIKSNTKENEFLHEAKLNKKVSSSKKSIHNTSSKEIENVKIETALSKNENDSVNIQKIDGKKDFNLSKDNYSFDSQNDKFKKDNVMLKEIPEIKKNNFSEELTKLINNAKIYVRNDKNALMNIKLNPKTLGEMNLKLGLENGILNAKFIVENNEAKDLLLQNMDSILQSLQNDGVNVGKFDVDVRKDNQNAQFAEAFTDDKKTNPLSHEATKAEQVITYERIDLYDRQINLVG